MDIPLVGEGKEAVLIPDIFVDPPGYQYPDVIVGSHSDKTYTVQNTGNGDLTVSSTELCGSNATEFFITFGGSSFSLIPSAARSITVRFAPDAEGNKQAALRLISNDPDENPVDILLSGEGIGAAQQPNISVDPVSYDYPDVVIGTYFDKTFTVTNKGEGDLIVVSSIISGTNYDVFHIIDGWGAFTLAPSETHDFVVRFGPTSQGIKQAFIIFTSNDPDENPKNVWLNGSGVSPQISMNTDSSSFGNVIIGSESTQNFSISNSGTGNLIVSKTELHGTDSEAFIIVQGGEGFLLAPMETHSISVSFIPLSRGIKSTSLQFTSNDPDTQTAEIILQGNGLNPPEMVVSSDSVDFGSVPIGSDSSQTIYIKNNGDADLVVGNVRLLGDHSDAFRFTGCDTLFILPAGNIQTVTVHFQPVLQGDQQCVLLFETYDTDTLIKEISLYGRGMSFPNIQVSCYSLDFGSVYIGRDSTQTLTLMNGGEIDLTIFSASLAGTDADQFTIIEHDSIFHVSPGDTHAVRIIFHPTMEGKREGILRFHSNDPDSSSIDISLTGLACSLDQMNPALSQCYPPAGSSEVPRNMKIEFKITDPGTGIDKASIHTTLNGYLILSEGQDQTNGRVSLIPCSSGYRFVFMPLSDLPEYSIVSIRVICQDRAFPPNTLDSLYTFMTGGSHMTVTTTQRIGYEGGVVICDSTDISITIPAGALSDTTDISISMISNPPALPDSTEGISLTYHFGPEGLKFKEGITLRMPYSQVDLDSAGVGDPMDLVVYYLLTSNGEWITLDIFAADQAYLYIKVDAFCFLVYGKGSTATGNEEILPVSNPPGKFVLKQNYPNPFNPETCIYFEIPERGEVRLNIYNAMGQEIRMLIHDFRNAGVYQVFWDGKNKQGDVVSSGIYHIFVRFKDVVQYKKAVFLK